MKTPSRIRDLQRLLKRERLDGCFVTHQPDLNFLTDFPLEGYALLVGRRKVWAFMPKLLQEQFEAEVPGCAVVPGAEMMRMLKRLVSSPDGLVNRRGPAWGRDGRPRRRFAYASGRRPARVAFDPERESYQSGVAWKKLKFLDLKGLVSELRAVKEGEELRRVSRACSIAARAFRIVGPRIRPGRTELSVADELESVMRRMGAESVAFDLIVAAGPNGALPHHRTSAKLIRRDEAVVVDFGCTYKLYRSDMTRTVFTGIPRGEFKRVYEIVERSQREGIRALGPGVAAGRIDKVCRDVIAEEGYGDRFIHSTGHGVGLDIHENPRIGPGSKETLRAGMVVTVEPGIYLLNRFGVRIEDTLLVTRNGSRLLTRE